MHGSQLSTRETNALLLAGLVGMGIGLFIPIAVEQATDGKTFWLVSAPLTVPVVLLMALRPVLGAVAFIGFGFINPSSLPTVTEVGPLSLRYVDGVFCLFIAMVLARGVIGRRTAILGDVRQLFTPLLLFLLYIGLSLILVRISAPGFVGASIASYLRLLLTASLVPVLCITLRDDWDIQFFNKTVILFSLATVAVGAVLVWTHGPEALAARSGGVIGIGPLGLVSGLLILYAFIERDRNVWSMTWILSLTAGVLGLYLAKTATAIFAVAVTSAAYFAVMRSRRFDLLTWTVVGTVMLTVAAMAIFSFRQGDVIGVADLSGGSFAERLMIAYAGLQIFLDSPVVGVGWQATTSEAIITSPHLLTAVTGSFPHLESEMFFVKAATSLHNMYIQFLAELGVIGFALFVWAAFRTAKSVARIVKSTSAESPYRVWVQFYALGLIYLLVWWNNSTLFGGQIETMLAFTFLAALVNVAQLEKKRLGQFSLINRAI
jgi:O-antigen ligase